MSSQEPKYSINELAYKWQQGLITAEEKAYYEKWYASFNDEQLIVNNASAESEDLLAAQLYTKVMHQIDDPKRSLFTLNNTYKWFGVAACIALVFAFALYNGNYRLLIQRAEVASHPINPGTYKASITLANGKTIQLNSLKKGVEINSANLNYIDGTKLPQLNLQDGVSESMLVSTPRGGTYQVILPDGTKVWLNASSTISFASNFNNLKNRKVELHGEAYFEVSKSTYKENGRKKARTFAVSAGSQLIEVLGTHFNVKSYADESSASTTLLEGSVKVTTGNKTKFIVPGQQALSNSQGLTLSNINVNDAVAWINGNFQFNDEPIQDVMLTISRWYNFDVVYQGSPPKERIGGTISRSQPIAQVLASLEETAGIKFKIEGRRVIVMP